MLDTLYQSLNKKYLVLTLEKILFYKHLALVISLQKIK